MFSNPVDPDLLPSLPVILHSHWQYTVKIYGLHCSRMYFDGSKQVAPQSHTVTSKWPSCVADLPVKRLFLVGITAYLGLTVFGGNTTDIYTHSQLLMILIWQSMMLMLIGIKCWEKIFFILF